MGSPTQLTTWTVEQMESIQELEHRALGNASARAMWGLFSASGQLQFLNSKHYSSHNLTLIVDVQTLNSSPTLIRDIRLTSNAKELLERDPPAFFKRCGDSYVYSVQTGSKLLGIFHVSTTSRRDKEELAAALSGSYGPIAGSAEFETKIAKKLSGRRMKVEAVRTGGNGTPLPLTLKQLLSAAENFPRTTRNSAAAFSMALRGYETVATFPRRQADDSVLATAWSASRELQSRIRNLGYALGHQAEFACLNTKKLRAQLAEQETRLANLRASAIKCLNGSAEACKTAESESLLPSAPTLTRYHEIKRETFRMKSPVVMTAPSGYVCTPLGVEGRYSPWPKDFAQGCGPARGACWRACPSLPMKVRTDFTKEFDSKYDDNRGKCTYTLGCVPANDAYLLQCDPEDREGPSVSAQASTASGY